MTRGWYLTLADDGPRAELIELDDAALRPAPDARDAVADVDVRVTWSSLNYKDALAFAGNAGVVRLSPLVPGIDVVGVVTAARRPRGW